jgi:hypothetical protein
MHRLTGFQGAFWPFIYAPLQFRRPLKNPSSHLAVHLSLTAKDTGYWQFQRHYSAFIQLLTNTFLYSVSLTPCPTSLQHFILLFVNSLSYYLRHLILLLIKTLSYFSPTLYPVSLHHLILLLIKTVSCFSPTPYPASHTQIILPISSTLFCLSLETKSASSFFSTLSCFSSATCADCYQQIIMPLSCLYPASRQHFILPLASTLLRLSQTPYPVSALQLILLLSAIWFTINFSNFISYLPTNTYSAFICYLPINTIS